MSTQAVGRARARLARMWILAAIGTAVVVGTGGATMQSKDVLARVVLSGEVFDVQTGAAIEGAVVSVTSNGQQVMPVRGSTADGAYRVIIERVPRGAKLPVLVRRVGYEAVRTEIIASRDSIALNVSLRPANQRLSEVVITGDVPKTERSVVHATAAIAVGATAAAPPPGIAPRQRITTGYDLKRAKAAGESRDQDRRDVRFDPRNDAGGNREQYDRILDNPFLAVNGNPLSTFSVDVDRASYGNVRRFLKSGQLPPADAVRIEELVNYFPYTLAEPRGDAPVAITTEATPAPWQSRHQLVRIALQARRINTDRLPASNLVFLIDVSGSMQSPDKLPLVKQSLQLLVEQLRPQDRVAMVVYAGAAGLVLPSTSGAEKARIMEAIERLEAGGSTAGGAGLELAYKTARDHFEREGNNRVILATDGDFNVGVSSDAAMERLIESKRAEGTYLTVLGFGTGNYQDAKMEKMAKVGNGNYAYVDDIAEARKVLVREMGATLVTVANDVKLQIEFNPKRVAAYRLIGYEDRLLRNEDFADDKKDAGDMGAGHTVTALYEVVPVGVRGTVKIRETDALRYERPEARESRDVAADDDELLYVKLRYKKPGESTSKLVAKSLRVRDVRSEASSDLRFASAVAAFGMLMRDSEHKGSTTVADVLTLARDGADDDEDGYRGEFIGLVKTWQSISRNIASRPGTRDR